MTANRFSRIFPIEEKGLLKSLFSDADRLWRRSRFLAHAQASPSPGAGPTPAPMSSEAVHNEAVDGMNAPVPVRAYGSIVALADVSSAALSSPGA